MTTNVKKIKAKIGFHGTTDPDVLKQLNIVHDGMDGNSAFPALPVDMTVFKKGIDLFNTLITDAEDGGKKAISAKNKQREEMIKEFTLLAHYVEAVSNGDPATFSTSGFVAVSGKRTPPQPLPPASIDWIDRGASTGAVVVKPKGLPGALTYDVRYGVVVNGSMPPAAWTTLILPGSKKLTISNLTPGATYAFQVRAYGWLGYTDWSDSMTFICG